MIGEILDPKVPWQVLLRDYMTRMTPDDLESWNRPNRRFEDIFLPVRTGVKMGPILFIGDTSGSIGNEDLISYASETNAIAEDLNPEKITFMWADTRVAGVDEFDQGTFAVDQLKPKGGGGTDMCVPLKAAEEYEPEIVVLFTDGYTPWPSEEPPYPLIVCCTTDTTVPVGQCVRI
jgi:predicted metal-dependent peptidase